MNDQQIDLVKESWAAVAPIAPTAATLFYDRLFSTAPGVRPLFPDDITEQKTKLMEMITTVVDGLDRPQTIAGEIEDLGRRHAAYGARTEHYDVVADCLLWTLAQGLGEDFTPEVRAAWTAAYALLATTMIAAAATAATPGSEAPAISPAASSAQG